LAASSSDFGKRVDVSKLTNRFYFYDFIIRVLNRKNSLTLLILLGCESDKIKTGDRLHRCPFQDFDTPNSILGVYLFALFQKRFQIAFDSSAVESDGLVSWGFNGYVECDGKWLIIADGCFLIAKIDLCLMEKGSFYNLVTFEKNAKAYSFDRYDKGNWTKNHGEDKRFCASFAPTQKGKSANRQKDAEESRQKKGSETCSRIMQTFSIFLFSPNNTNNICKQLHHSKHRRKYSVQQKIRVHSFTIYQKQDRQ